MKISIQTFTGMGWTYGFNVEPSITIQQLKRLLLKETGDDDDLQTIYFEFNGSILEDDDKTLSDYNIQDESELQLVDLSITSRDGFGSTGTVFSNLSNSKGLKKIEWSKTCPRWRISTLGLCLEGLCTNDLCEAYEQRVIMPIGYQRFDILTDPNETTTMCPICKKYVEPETCSFNNCWWKYEGIKQDETTKSKPPQKCSSDWIYADDAYHYFDQEVSGMAKWKQLIVEAVKDKPHYE